MSDDILAKAEGIIGRKTCTRDDMWQAHGMLPELVAEIKRQREKCEDIRVTLRQTLSNLIDLQEQLADKDLHITSLETMAHATAESHLQFVDAHFEQEKKWEEESKTKDDEIRKWQEIAIEATAKYKAIFDQSRAICHFGGMDAYREEAAKELSLPHDSYLDRLEDAFQTLYMQTHWRKPDESYEDQIQEAREALEKIRHAK